MIKTLAVLCALAAPVAASAAPLAGSSYQDVGDHLFRASEASVGSQFLALPLPMTNLKQGRWQVGADAGYSEVEAGILTQKGPLGSVAGTYSFADHWGVYGLAFVNRLNVAGGGQSVLVTPWASTPLDTPNLAQFSNLSGTLVQQGAGIAAVWDPISKDEDSDSWPVYAGLIVDNLVYDRVSMNYLMTTGASAGQSGTLDFSKSYVFAMPMIGTLYSHKVGKDWEIIPSILGAFSTSRKPTHAKITGPGFVAEGDSGSVAGTGNGSYVQPFVGAAGFSVVYRPWGVGANLGAMAFQSLVGKSMYDGVDKVLRFDLSWRWNNRPR